MEAEAGTVRCVTATIFVRQMFVQTNAHRCARKQYRERQARDASRLENATKQAAEALAHRFGSGAIEGRIRAFVITAIR